MRQPLTSNPKCPADATLKQLCIPLTPCHWSGLRARQFQHCSLPSVEGSDRSTRASVCAEGVLAKSMNKPTGNSVLNCCKILDMVSGSQQVSDLWPNSRAKLSSPATFACTGAGWPIGCQRRSVWVKTRGAPTWNYLICTTGRHMRCNSAPSKTKKHAQTQKNLLGAEPHVCYWHQTSVAAVSSTALLKNWAALSLGSAPPERSASSSKR